MTLMQALLAKQKADEEKAARRRALRRGYAQGRRERGQARRLAESGLDDLPLEVVVGIEETLKTPTPEPATPVEVATVENLRARLEAIKERIFRLHAVYAVSLSIDVAIEANRYLTLFQCLASELEKKDSDALAKIITGHEAILLSPTVPVKQSIPIETQRLVELRWEVNRAPSPRVHPRPVDTIHDGLGWML